MDPKTHRKALRAARSVVVGARRQILPSLAGLALVAYLPACGGGAQTGPPHIYEDLSNQADTATEVNQATNGCLQMTEASCSEENPCDDLEMVCLEGTCYAQDFSMAATSEPGACPEMDHALCPEDSICVEDRCYEIGEATLAAQACCNDIAMTGEGNGIEALGVPGCNPCYMQTEFACNEDDSCTGLGLHCIDDQCWAGQFSSVPVGVSCSEEEPCEVGFCQGGVCLESNRVGHETMDLCCQKHFRVYQFALAGCTPWGPPAPPAYDGSRLSPAMRV